MYIKYKFLMEFIKYLNKIKKIIYLFFHFFFDKFLYLSAATTIFSVVKIPY